MTILKQNRMVLYFQENGPGSTMTPLGIGKYGGDDGTEPGIGKGVTYGSDKDGRPIAIVRMLEAPGGLPTKTLNFYEEDTKNRLLRARDRGQIINVQERYHKAIALDNPFGWNSLWHWGNGTLGDRTIGAGAVREYAGEGVVSSIPVVFDRIFEFFRPVLSQETGPTSAIAENANVILFLDDLVGVAGYPGPDQIGYAGLDAVSLATAKVLYNATGGGSWEPTSADPFAADEHVTSIAYNWVGERTYRLIVGTNVTDAGAKAKFAYADIDPGTPQTTTWTSVVATGGSNGDVTEALAWPWIEELILATAGDIYVESNQGDSWASTAIYTGSTQINAIVTAPQDPDLDEYVIILGASNLILKKRRGRNSISTLSGPAGGGAFTAGAIAVDGTLYAGNGQSIYSTKDDGVSWTQLKDFGSSRVVEGIGLAHNDPEVIQVAVDNTTPGTGEYWISADGGSTWEQTTALSNNGYNGAYFSERDPNFVMVVADDDTTNVVIHKASDV